MLLKVHVNCFIRYLELFFYIEKLANFLHNDSCIVTESPETDRIKDIINFNNGPFVLAQLCMQADFNENTPRHLACQHNAHALLKRVNPICMQHAQLLFNEDGLNPFLLAARHSSVKIIKLLVQSMHNEAATSVENAADLRRLLVGVDKLYAKNCLHYACGRGCGKDALSVVKYLTSLAQLLDKEAASHVDLNNNNVCNSKPVFYQLIGSVSPLVGSVYHVAASNLTRLSTLWYLLNLYPIHGIFLDNLDTTAILDKLDFREFTAVDCLVDSVMNLREMAPPGHKDLASFYAELIRPVDEKYKGFFSYDYLQK